MSWIKRIATALKAVPLRRKVGDAVLAGGNELTGRKRRIAVGDDGSIKPTAERFGPGLGDDTDRGQPESFHHQVESSPMDQMNGRTRALAEAAATAYRKSSPSQRQSPERAALIREAMSHWAKGHAIFQGLDPTVRDTVRVVAERLDPK